MGHSVANGSRHFFERSCVAAKRNDVEISSPTCFMLRRNTARRNTMNI